MILGCTDEAQSERGGWTDMVALEFIILGVLNVLSLAGLVALALWIRSELENAVAALDHSLALAIQSTIKELGGAGLAGFEQINPIQQAIAQFIASAADQKMNTINAVVTDRAADGKFASIEKP
jgi:hypothetical protein